MKKSTVKANVLEFTTKFINSNFRIKVFGHDEDGKKINTLVGVSGILKLIGAELLNKFVKRALKAGTDACRCALRSKRHPCSSGGCRTSRRGNPS